jgi:hypothetical protein
LYAARIDERNHTHYVKCRKVQHLDHIYLCIRIRIHHLFHLFSHEINILHQKRLLFSQRLIREGMRKNATRSRMVCIICIDDASILKGSEVIKLWIFVVPGLAWWLEAVDILKGLRTDETQLVWGDAHNWAVLAVQRGDPLDI